jgi:SLOG cluster2
MLQAGRPTYLCGAFGGAAALVIELLEGRVPQEFTWEYQRQAPHSEAMLQLYKDQGIPWQSYEDLALICKGIGVAGLSMRTKTASCSARGTSPGLSNFFCSASRGQCEGPSANHRNRRCAKQVSFVDLRPYSAGQLIDLKSIAGGGAQQDPTTPRRDR